MPTGEIYATAAERLHEGDGPIHEAVYPHVAPAAARTLLDVLSASVSAHPAELALDDGRARLTYRELSTRVTKLAGDLTAAGIGVGDRVGVRVPSGTADLYVAILAALTAGAAYVPSDVDDPTSARNSSGRRRVCAPC
jgi:non-ribosomal peptide synthetase component F